MPAESDRALVNGEPCVRAALRVFMRSFPACEHCPFDKTGKCDSSCGLGFEWVRETEYVIMRLESTP